ncbi:MAG: DUF6114 domain-containing protein [Candidatus Bathyarchaeota archaeon]|jgi:hypothetical protein|nr:hypothetical protein [Candidatus Bathyarchaeota archaeon A05DMB-5]MDH7557089.1 DUF6114 domain-containing protein [Candidatus Bathyarchaeota archaeon]
MRTSWILIIASIVSLVSGVFIILGGILSYLWLCAGWEMKWLDETMHQWKENVKAWHMEGVIQIMSIAGIAIGLLVIVLAVMVYLKPLNHKSWGGLIITFSAISLWTGMGGLSLGFILGLVGGVLTILGKPRKTIE